MMASVKHILDLLTQRALQWALAVLCACLTMTAGAAADSSMGSGLRETDSSGAATEMHLPADQPLTPWIHDPAIFTENQGDIKETRETTAQEVTTIKLDKLVPPIHFGLGEVVITEAYLQKLRDVLERMQDRHNVRLHFMGHADNLPLSGELQKIYTDNMGLSRERAGTVAEYCQQALNLPPEAISYEGFGDTRPVADNATEEGRRRNRRVEVQVWYDEIGETTVQEEVFVPRQLNRFKVCRSETVCKLRYKAGHANRAQVKNLIAPLRYDRNNLTVPDRYLTQIRQAVTNLGGKEHLIVSFTAYADDTPLTGREARIYGDALGYSKAVARRIAQVVQETLDLPNDAVQSQGRGASHPVADNLTEQGRALNRRIEVSFWYDDPLQDLPDEPQLCPDAAGADTVSRVYNSPSGGIEPILFAKGQPVVPPGSTGQLRKVMHEINGKANVRLRFIGYTSNRRLDRRTAAIYGDDIGLSMARARRAMEAVCEQMDLAPEQAEYDGRGYVQADDVVNAGFIESDISKVKVQVVYDEPVILDDYEGVEITPITREVTPADPFALNYMRITVDGQPLDDPGECSSDIQRCTDVALDQANIQFKHDSLKTEPRLNVTAWPRSVGVQGLAGFSQVRFRMYSNYRSFIDSAEVRIFEAGQSTRDVPVAVVEINADGQARWQPEPSAFSAPVRQLQYLLRVYDAKGRFDETIPQPLWMVEKPDPQETMADVEKELLTGYGESRISFRNIPIHGGTVQAFGTGIPETYGVWMAGHTVPVDDSGSFVAEEILPDGTHTVEVAVLDPFGNGELFLRDLELKPSDWFTVGIADLTFSANFTEGPAALLSPDRRQYSEDMSVYGRLGFYTNGTFANDWELTASADTREGPVQEIFSNFLDKSPEALFRRIDPDYHYPTFGDDSTVVEDAPTSGKFFVKAKKDETYGMWGNFKIGYLDNDLAHVDRGLYGANLHLQPTNTTSFGEPRLMVDGFAADPGTIAGRDEFRGTGGSLFWLRRQDILIGSERVRIEIRDKDSGIVLGVKNLTPVLDYDVDYLQGRILLSQPLPTTADDTMLVSTAPISGNPTFLVVRYEFTPGFEDPDTVSVGGRVHYWFNDFFKVGVTTSQDEAEEKTNTIGGADLTLRKSAATWLRFETGRTQGAGATAATSVDGGYDFGSTDAIGDNDTEASAHRVDASLGFNDLFDSGRGQLTAYWQTLEAGYTAPGLATARDQSQYGARADLPITDRLSTRAKVDKVEQDQGLATEAGEVDVDYQLGSHWIVSSGVRHDNRTDHSAVVPATQEEGQRTDAVARLTYDSHLNWKVYSFVQDTVHTSGNREENGRIGGGGAWRISDRFKVNGEVSDGDLGLGGILGTEFLYSDRTTLYANYALENERSDNGLRARKGSMTSGFRTRYSDNASVFLEERYTHGDTPSGLMHSTGVELAPYDRLNLGANLDFGTLKDPQTSAELERKAVGVSVGYGLDRFNIFNALEYRRDDSELPDSSFTERTTWLFKNSFKCQLTPDWRLLGKLNHSTSESSQGEYYNGDYTEAVIGYAYRPVRNDRLNALFKYTYFYNMPSTDQVVGSTTPVIQRSHIASLDVLYDLTARWTVGGKYAYRHGEVAMDRENPEFFPSDAHLYIARIDWHFIHRWDALLEVRRLELPDAMDSRDGALIGLYRHLGNHIKVGAGYNFSDFSDDLTEMDYRHQGLFINMIGKI